MEPGEGMLEKDSVGFLSSLSMSIVSLLSFFLSPHTHSSKQWLERAIVLGENYNGEGLKAYLLYGPGYEGVCLQELLLCVSS